MRIRFFENGAEAETACFLETHRQVARFWECFRAESARIASGSLSGRLQALLPSGLVSELLPGEGRGPATCVIRPASDLALGPLAEWVAREAPTIAGWCFAAARPRRSLARALVWAQERTGRDWSHAKVRLGFGRGHLLEAVIKSHWVESSEDEAAQIAAEELLAALLGDQVFDRWLGAVTVEPGPKPSSLKVIADGPEEAAFMPLAEVATRVDQAIHGLSMGLGEAPYHRYCERAEWTLLDIEPAGSSLASMVQRDLVLCSTMLPEMMKCFLQGDLFASERFSRTGEIFAYLKYRGGSGSLEARYQERLLLEDALNRGLVPFGLGCVVAAGLGERYGYLTLALADLEHGLMAARKISVAAEVPGPAWILFCDSAWRKEWLAVGPHHLPPPEIAGEST